MPGVQDNHRHSQRRLIIALAVSAALTTSILILVPNPFANTARSVVGLEQLTVVLERRSSEVLSEIAVPDYKRRDVSDDQTNTGPQQNAATDAHEDSPGPNDTGNRKSELSDNVDWYEVGRTSVHRIVDQRFRDEEIRKKMWQQTGSVMFAGTGDFDFLEPESIIAAREFRRPVGVLGLGFTIGGCFFGIPLAGIPVEERGVGPNVIYCTDIYE